MIAPIPRTWNVVEGAKTAVESNGILISSAGRLASARASSADMTTFSTTPSTTAFFPRALIGKMITPSWTLTFRVSDGRSLASWSQHPRASQTWTTVPVTRTRRPRWLSGELRIVDTRVVSLSVGRSP
jgi:hypothetical protein